MKKILILVVSAALILNIGVGAVFAQDPVTVDVENSSVTVSGTDAMPESRVTIQVYLGENTAATLETLTPEKYMEILVCHDQTYANAEGKYTFSFDIENKTNDYTAFIKVEGSNSVIEKTFPFVNMQQFKDVVDDVNESTSVDITRGLLLNNKEVFGFTQEKISGINIGEFSKIIYNYTLSGNKLSNTDRLSVLEIIDHAYFVQQLNEKAIPNIYTYSEVNRLAESSISQWCNQNFVTEALEKDFTDRLSGKGFTKLEQYENALMEAFMLSVVENPNGFANITSVASAFSEQLGIPVERITDGNCKRVAGNDYSTVEDFIEALKPTSGGGGSSSGSGSGAGSGSAAGGLVITNNGKPVSDIEKEKLDINIFNDLVGYKWAEDAITELAERGIVNGKGQYKFHPSDFVTREEFVKMLVTALKIPVSTEKINFSDTDEKEWYYKYLQTAVNAGIVKGKADGTFGIGEKISRQDMAHMAYNALKATQLSFNEEKLEEFADDSIIADYAKVSVYALKNKGIINGIGNNLYDPLACSERAAAAKIVYMLITL